MKPENKIISIPEGWDKTNEISIGAKTIVIYYEQNGDKKMRTYKVVED